MEVSGLLHTPATLSPGKNPWHSLYSTLSELQRQSGHGGEKKKFLAPARN